MIHSLAPPALNKTALEPFDSQAGGQHVEHQNSDRKLSWQVESEAQINWDRIIRFECIDKSLSQRKLWLITPSHQGGKKSTLARDSCRRLHSKDSQPQCYRSANPNRNVTSAVCAGRVK